MQRQSIDPTITQVISPTHDSVMTHPAFGQISASRTQGDSVLYGSDFVHKNSIRIHVYGSVLHRGLSNDWPHATQQFMEVELSEAQWATFISSMNVGSGVQCTLRHVDGHQVPGITEPVRRVEQFKAEADETVQKAHESLAALEAKIEEMGLSEKRKRELLGSVESARRAIGNSLNFVAKQFDEHMENTVEKAKIEVNAYVTTTIQRAGLEHLGAKPIQIGLNSDE